MPLHAPIIPVPRRLRRGQVAALAVATCATAAVTIVIADAQLAPQSHAIAKPSRPAVTRYFDIEANKAASMRALGRHIAAQRANHPSRYEDIEANKARSQRAH